MFFRHLIFLLPLVLLLGLPGCGSPAQRAQQASPDYKIGYDDGCATASTQGANARKDSTIRDEAAWQGNPAYRAGWNTGFNTCRVNQSGGQPGTPNRGPLSDPYGALP
jgi:hypothetical protein